MSFSTAVSTLSAAATTFSGVVAALTGGSGAVRPGSFRGVPFVIEVGNRKGGRRKVVHQFALRDDPYIEDIGRAAKNHRLRVFVLGADYMDQRDALLSACEDDATSGTLVHPYFGEIECSAGVLDITESKDLGGYAAFDIEFHEGGGQPSPRSVTDTAGGLLDGLTSLLPVITAGYAIVSQVMQNPGLLLGVAEQAFGELSGELLGLPAGTIVGLASAIAGLAGFAGDDAAAAAAVFAVFTGAADNVAIVLSPPPMPDDPVTGQVPIPPPGADLTGGLGGLAAWTGGLAPIIPVTPVQAAMAAQQAAIVGLVQGAATAAVLQVYAAIEWPSANAAAAALSQVLELVDARTQAAADSGLDDLYRGWQAVGGMAVQDLTQRAQQLPRLARYSLAGSLPSLALAQRLYGDASRAEELVALNDVLHPAFMPRAGYRLMP